MEKIQVEQHSAGGVFWAVGWIFTIGFVHLTFWQGVLALFLWPYFLGTTLSALLR
jgi:hypothetical protein